MIWVELARYDFLKLACSIIKLFMNSQEFPPQKTVEEVLRDRGVERLPDGRLVLYHATTAEHFAQISKTNSLRPSAETGARNWGFAHEVTEDRGNKIYLGSKDFVEKQVMKGIVAQKGGRAFLLKTKVPEAGLEPDEDTHASSWHESLDTLGSCSFRGAIPDVELVSVGDPVIPREQAFKMFKEAIDKKFTDEESDESIATAKAAIVEAEQKMLKEAGVNIELTK